MEKIRFLFVKRYAFPSEHGSWIWWIGPFLIGIAAAGGIRSDLLWLVVAMFAAFLFRQPTMMLVKSVSGRRPKADRTPSLIWAVLYAALALWGYGVLLRKGYDALLYLPLPGIPVFFWHLRLVSRRAERGQRGIEIVGAGVLALAAPAAYWVNGGTDDRLAWILWGLTWLQSAASIVLVYLRLEQRKWDASGSLKTRVHAGWRTIAYHLFNLVLGGLFYLRGWIPLLMLSAFGLMFLDALDGVVRPAVGTKPTRIGLRQLAASGIFVLLSILGFVIIPA